MKIQKPVSRKKILIIALTATLLVLGGGVVLGAMNNWWQPKKEQPTGSEESRDNRSKESLENQPSKEETPPPAETPYPNDQSIIIPPADKPPTQSQFPVENSHYRIDKKSSSSYEVTLYAILNNPSQRDEYTAQLRQFKKEALEYMKERFGSIDALTFTWSPPEAKDL